MPGAFEIVMDERKALVDKIIDRIIDTSECPIHEIAQDRSFYSPATDEIYLPLRSQFKDQTSFAKTLLHELAHSSGHPSRLNRQFGGPFGSEGYAKEELRAEIGALFTETNLGIPLSGEHYEDHSDYLRSWIGVIQNDYNEFFRACFPCAVRDELANAVRARLQPMRRRYRTGWWEITRKSMNCLLQN